MKRIAITIVLPVLAGLAFFLVFQLVDPVSSQITTPADADLQAQCTANADCYTGCYGYDAATCSSEGICFCSDNAPITSFKIEPPKDVVIKSINFLELPGARDDLQFLPPDGGVLIPASESVDISPYIFVKASDGTLVPINSEEGKELLK